MSSHTTSKGKSRKVALLLNGQSDADVKFFHVKVSGIAAATATTTLIADAQIASDEVVRVMGWSIVSDGSAWTSGTNIKIQDSSGVVVTTVATAALPTSTAGVAIGKGTQTIGEGFCALTAGKGLQLVQTGTYSGAALLTVYVWGCVTTTASLNYV